MDVAIVGGGISGICCAQRLNMLGSSVTLIEARSKLGGRTNSICFTSSDGKPLWFNIGAAWVHGTNNNPLMELLRTHKIPTIENSGQVGLLDHLYFPHSSNELTSDERKQVVQYMKQLQSKFLDVQSQMDEDRDRSMADVIAEILSNSTILHKQFHNNNRVGKAIRWLVSQIEQYEAASLENISTFHTSLEFGRDSELEERAGVDHVVVTYEHLIQSIAKQLPSKDIITNDPVHQIDYSNNGTVKITLESGRICYASKVVVTASLGVLQANKIQFIPPLPKQKQEAIQRVGFGLMNKVILQFEKCFWDPNCHSFGVITEPSTFGYWLNHYPICGKPVLIAFSAGPFACRIKEEKWTDEKILNSALDTVASCFPNIQIPPLLNSYITHWENEEWILGSYSYSHFRSTFDDYDVIAAPVDDKIFFAGEHTNREEHSYVHGAYESGIREANRIHKQFSTKDPTARL